MKTPSLVSFRRTSLYSPAVPPSSLRQGRQRGRLGDGDVGDALAEVGLGGLLDAVTAVAVVDRVQVGLQDLILGEGVLDLQRVVGLDDLPPVVVVELGVRQVQVSGQLLGDGTGAADLSAVAELLQNGADDTDHVEAVVGPEGLVLQGDEGVLYVDRDLIDRHVVPVAAGGEDGVHLLALVVVDDRGLVQQIVEGRRIDGRCLGEGLVDVPGHRRYAGGDDDEEQDQECLQDPELFPLPMTPALDSGTGRSGFDVRSGCRLLRGGAIVCLLSHISRYPFITKYNSSNYYTIMLL